MTIPEFKPIAWTNKQGDYFEAVRKDTVFGSHTRPLYTSDQLTEAYEAGKMEQAAQIEMMREALGHAFNGILYYHHAKLVKIGIDAANEALNISPDQALEQFATKVREQCQMTCLEKHANGNWKYDTREECAEAIAAIKELPK